MAEIQTVYYDADMKPVPKDQGEFFVERETDENGKTIQSQFGRVVKNAGNSLQESILSLMQ